MGVGGQRLRRRMALCLRARLRESMRFSTPILTLRWYLFYRREIISPNCSWHRLRSLLLLRALDRCWLGVNSLTYPRQVCSSFFPEVSSRQQIFLYSRLAAKLALREPLDSGDRYSSSRSVILESGVSRPFSLVQLKRCTIDLSPSRSSSKLPQLGDPSRSTSHSPSPYSQNISKMDWCWGECAGERAGERAWEGERRRYLISWGSSWGERRRYLISCSSWSSVEPVWTCCLWSLNSQASRSLCGWQVSSLLWLWKLSGEQACSSPQKSMRLRCESSSKLRSSTRTAPSFYRISSASFSRLSSSPSLGLRFLRSMICWRRVTMVLKLLPSTTERERCVGFLAVSWVSRGCGGGYTHSVLVRWCWCGGWCGGWSFRGWCWVCGWRCGLAGRSLQWWCVICWSCAVSLEARSVLRRLREWSRRWSSVQESSSCSLNFCDSRLLQTMLSFSARNFSIDMKSNVIIIIPIPHASLIPSVLPQNAAKLNTSFRPCIQSIVSLPERNRSMGMGVPTKWRVPSKLCISDGVWVVGVDRMVLRIRKIKMLAGTIINPQKGFKTFVFEKEETQQSILVEYELDLRQNFINLNYLLSIYCPLHHHKVSIYDPNANRFASLDKLGAQNGFLHKQYLEPRVILMRYKRKFEYAPDSDGPDSSLEPDSLEGREGREGKEGKEGRSRERTIAEVIELVKRWRDLHLHGHKSLKRRLNLQDAARLVGISKKSLDDYYCQLRLGQFYNFDFPNKLHEKMGILRSYVKDYKPDKDNKRRQNQKHPKNLRVIEQFELETKTLRLPENELPEEEPPLEEDLPAMLDRQLSLSDRKQFVPQELPFDESHDSNQVFEELFHLEHDFFKGFELVLDEPVDPYMEVDRDFRKKDFEEDSSNFLFFDA